MTVVALLFLMAAPAQDAPANARELLDRVLEAHGSHALRRGILSFTFRGQRFRAERSGGRFIYERQQEQGGQAVVDRLSNEGFERLVNGAPTPLEPDKRRTFSESVNSVIYFASLPLALRDPAVQARLLEDEMIGGERYHRMEVTFRPEGGGTDHDDRFLYWFRAGTYEMDYLAYRYSREGGGIRFRVAKNPRTLNGVRIQDYDNYATQTLEPTLEALPTMWQADELEKLSEILTEEPSLILK